MRIWACAVAVLLLASSAVPASALNWSIGGNLGMIWDSPSDKDKDFNEDGVNEIESRTIFAWPFAGTMPGLRVGFTGASPQHEIYFDTGLNYTTEKDIGTTRAFTGTANYQYNFGSSGSMAPYLTGGVGLISAGLKDETISPAFDVGAMSVVYGGGVGIRHKMGNGNGTLRAEVRFDRVSEGTDTVGGSKYLVIPESSLVTLKLGFDLWDIAK